jgi:predicted transcriptional regulator
MKIQARNKRNNKLTLADATRIRVRRLAGETGPAIAREYGITKQMVYHIALGKEWA